MFQPRLSRADFRSGSPFRSQFRSGSPFSEECLDYGNFRYPSPYYNFKGYGDYGRDYPFSAGDSSPWRFSGDYAAQFGDYARQFRGSSPCFPGEYDYMYRSGDYEDYFCREDGERSRYSGLRSRAVSRDRVRFDRSAALYPDQDGWQRYGSQYGMRYRSLSPARYRGFPAGERRTEEFRTTVRARSLSPSYRRGGCFTGMGQMDAGQSRYMTSGDMGTSWRLRQGGDERQEVCSDSEMWRDCSTDRLDKAGGWRGRRETSQARLTQAVTGDRPMTSGMTQRLGSRRVGWC